MTLVVTGARGQLGREWMAFLGKKKIDKVTGLSSDQLDISDRAAVQQVLDEIAPDLIINCAAWTDVDGAESAYEAVLRVNRDGVAHLAEWCAENRARLVHYSTDYIFPGRKEDQQHYPAGYTEEAETAPVNAYGRSKLAGEQELRQSNAEYLLLRVSWLCGYYGENFVSKMLSAAEVHDSLNVVDDQIGSPTFTDQVVLWTRELLKREVTGTFHITSGGLTSWYGLASEIFRYRGHERVQIDPCSSESFPTKAIRPAFSKLDPGRLEHTLGVEMEPWQNGLHRLLNQMT